jgi:hypothetical protein
MDASEREMRPCRLIGPARPGKQLFCLLLMPLVVILLRVVS